MRFLPPPPSLCPFQTVIAFIFQFRLIRGYRLALVCFPPRNPRRSIFLHACYDIFLRRRWTFRRYLYFLRGMIFIFQCRLEAFVAKSVKWKRYRFSDLRFGKLDLIICHNISKYKFSSINSGLNRYTNTVIGRFWQQSIAIKAHWSRFSRGRERDKSFHRRKI